MTQIGKRSPLKKLSAAGGGLSLSMLVAACGGGGSSTSAPAPPPAPPPPPPPQTVQGTVFDGPIEGASVFRDENGNIIQDGDESFAISDPNGRFEIVEGSGNLVSTGGVDALTRIDFTGDYLLAPDNATILSPFTTLLAYASDEDLFYQRTGLSEVLANNPDFDLLSFSPFNPDGSVEQTFGEGILFLNQQASVVISFVRTIAEIVGEDEPLRFAYETIANNLLQAQPDTILVSFDQVVLDSLAQSLISHGAFEGFTSDAVQQFLAELLVVYLQPLA